jgi:hypothetical protein
MADQGWGPQQQQPPWNNDEWGRPQQPTSEQEGQRLPPPPRQGQPRGPQVRMQPSTGYSYQPPPQQGYYQGPPQGYPPSGPGSRGPKKRHTIRNVLLGAVGAIVLIIIIATVASSQNGVSKTSSPPAANAATSGPSSSPSAQPVDNSTTGPVGTTFTVTETTDSGATAKYSVTLDRFIQHAQPDNGFDTAPAGEHLAGAEFTIKGISSSQQDDANSDAAAIGTDSQNYQVGFEGLAAGTNFNDGDFNTSPGSVSIGWVTFEVKDGVHIASIQWNPGSGFSGDSPAVWTVGK